MDSQLEQAPVERPVPAERMTAAGVAGSDVARSGVAGLGGTGDGRARWTPGTGGLGGSGGVAGGGGRCGRSRLIDARARDA